jgi:hypothetical protein
MREQLRRQIGKGRVVRLLAVEPTRHPTHHAIEDRQQVAAGGRGEQRERQAVAGLDKHAIGDQEVEVNVQIDQTAEALHEGDGAGLGRSEAARTRDPPLPYRHRADDQAADPAGPRRLAGQAQPQGLGQREHPLAIRRAGQHAVEQMRRRVCHAACCAGRTDASAFAREGNQDLVVARLAAGTVVHRGAPGPSSVGASAR